MEDLELGRSGVVGLDEGRGRELDRRGSLGYMTAGHGNDARRFVGWS